VTVVDPRWVVPVPQAVVELARDHRLVVSVEDNVRSGGVGTALATALRDGGVEAALLDYAVDRRFLPHASRDSVLASLGLTAQDISRGIVETVARLDQAVDEGRGTSHDVGVEGSPSVAEVAPSGLEDDDPDAG
jgi:1-deoxy-D-xylulose-5-phosphate synthase